MPPSSFTPPTATTKYFIPDSAVCIFTEYPHQKTYYLSRLAVPTFADFLPSSLLPLHGRLGTALEAYDNYLKENTRRTV